VKDAAFQDLLTSVRQAGQIRRGTRRPSRTTTFRPTDVQAVRAKLGASQAEFARMIGVSVATLRNWEQGRRTPDGPALALLRVAARNPKAVIQALHTPSPNEERHDIRLHPTPPRRSRAAYRRGRAGTLTT
jgi:putative transcriptional regulator